MSIPRIDSEDPRLRRLMMRAHRRGIKEMDIVIGGFATRHASAMTPAELDHFEALMHENDQHLLSWITGQEAAPDAFVALIDTIRADALEHGETSPGTL